MQGEAVGQQCQEYGSNKLKNEIMYNVYVNEADEADALDVPERIEKSVSLANSAHMNVNVNAQTWVKAISEVVDSGKWNKDGCKIVVNNKWNFDLLQQLLVNYHDRDIVELLKYGWPIDRDEDAPLEMSGINHKGATDYEKDIDAYIAKELRLGTILGPFESIQFKCPVAISPLSTRAKKDSVSRRIIMDCSWPIGLSLNSGLDKDSYLGVPTNLKYPTTDAVCKYIYDLRQRNVQQLSIWLYKEDMDRAFRQLYADLKSVPLLSFKWRNLYYHDLVMVMGCTVAPYVCQRTTSMIAYIQAEMGYMVFNYVDDFLGIEYISKIHDAHTSLLRLFRDVGMSRSESKSVPPTQELEFIGNLLNTEQFTIGITPVRKVQILKELEKWRFKPVATRREMESLVGKLQFISACVKPGRLFVSRLLSNLKGMSRGRTYKLSNEARKDIKWWTLFLPGYNGTSIMWYLNVAEINKEFATDACLIGAGGVAGNQYYSVRFPEHLRRKEVNIVHLELWAIIIAIRLWGVKLTGKYIRVKTDNESVSSIINSGRSRDEMLQTQLRELVWWLSTYQVKLRAIHWPGRLNILPDLLSRWHEGRSVREEFVKQTEGKHMVRRNIDVQWFNYSHEW